jgi:hypothetical protein
MKVGSLNFYLSVVRKCVHVKNNVTFWFCELIWASGDDVTSVMKSDVLMFVILLSG